jgi:hypothetical protein
MQFLRGSGEASVLVDRCEYLEVMDVHGLFLLHSGLGVIAECDT